jgi:hypothetical protein
MDLIRLDSSSETSLAMVALEVTTTDRMRLGIEVITSIQGPLTADMRVLPPGQLRVHVRVRSSGIEATLVFIDANDKRELSQIQNIGSYRSGPLKMRDLQTLPLRKIRNELRRIIDDMQAKGDLPQALGSVGTAEDPSSAGPGRREVVTDEFLLKVADSYSHLDGTPGAIQLLQDRFGFSPTYMRQLVARARKAGFLAPTTSGKKNSQLTPKAKKLLLQAEQQNEGTANGDSN